MATVSHGSCTFSAMALPTAFRPEPREETSRNLRPYETRGLAATALSFGSEGRLDS